MSSVRISHVTKQYPRSGVVVDDSNFVIEDGEFFTLLGPSGCGKTTTLRMIAGFEEPTKGEIYFGERNVTFLPPNKRDVGIVFQNYALFPHMNVANNVAFGLKAHGVPKTEHEQRVKDALAQVSLTGMEQAKVDQLSGGQQQRVALARAIVIRPQLILLDEPLSNLDAKLRQDTRAALRLLHAETGLTSVYVTHDQSEALAMSTRIAVMSRAKVHQIGTPYEIYETPATRFVAGFVGRANIFDGVIGEIRDGIVVVELADGHSLQVRAERKAPTVKCQLGERVGVQVRAESIDLNGGDAGLPIEILDVEYIGSRVECLANSAFGQVKMDARVSRGLERGDRLSISISPEAAYLVEADDDGALAQAEDHIDPLPVADQQADQAPTVNDAGLL